MDTYTLVSLLDGYNHITRPLGINVNKKFRHPNGRNIRLYILFCVLWCDWLYSVGISFIPTDNDNEHMLMVLGDWPYHLMNENRFDTLTN